MNLAKRQKKALIVRGGGMQACFAGGAVSHLFRSGWVPEIVIAGSGGAPTAVYAVAGQVDMIEPIWLTMLSTRKLIDLRRFRKVINLDYLVHQVFSQSTYALDIDGYRNSPIDCYIGCTDVVSGEVRFFSNRDEDIPALEALRATMAYPVLSGTQVSLRGKYYTDGLFSCGDMLQVEFARSLGATEIVIINNGLRGIPFWLFNVFLWRSVLRYRNARFRRRQLSYWRRLQTFEYPPEVIAVISPEEQLLHGLLNTNPEAIKNSLSKGVVAANHLVSK